MFSELVKNFILTVKGKNRTESKVAIFSKLTILMMKKKFTKGKNVTEKISGYHITGTDYFSLDFLYKEIFCEANYFFKTSALKPVIIDCGGNIGMATLYFKKIYPDSRVITFEPNPEAFSLLEKNIRDNNIKNVECHNVALYDEEKQISFFISEESGVLRSSLKKDRGGKTELLVSSKRLSDYLKTIDKIDLIKIDVEGAEINIIEDLFRSGTLAKADRYIIEYHHNMNNEKPQLSDFLKRFEAVGFKYSINARFYRLDGFQEILLYFYKNERNK